MTALKTVMREIYDMSSPRQMRERAPFIVSDEYYQVLIGEMKLVRTMLDEPYWREGEPMILAGRPVMTESMMKQQIEDENSWRMLRAG